MARHNFSKFTIAERFRLCGGRCEGILETGLRCDAVLKGGDYECDHDLADGLGGKPTLENARILCILCHDRKTPGDQRKIAKVKRLVVKDCGVPERPKQKIPSPPKVVKERRFDRTSLPPRALYQDTKEAS